MRAFFILILSFLSVSCAQRLDEIERRMDSLDERNRALESASGLTVNSDREVLEGRRVADLRSQVTTLRNEVTVLKGQMENMEFTNRSLEERLNRLETRPDPTRDNRPAGMTRESGSRSEEVYREAMRAHQRGQFDQSRALFLKFLEEFPQDPLADNALFWVAESHRSQNQQREALLRYQDLIEKYPQSDKRCQAMAHQIEALTALGMTSEASAFTEVKNAECPSKN
jgi:TolA-binding protein